jgi:SAM-dependent methyltransferase
VNGYHIVKCRACGLAFVAESVTPEAVLGYYGEGYYTGAQPQGYADYPGQRSARMAHFRSLIPTLEKQLATSHPSVLDVGCALGFFLEVARERGWSARGVELSPFAAERARSRSGLDVLTGTIEDARLDQERFDLITFWDVIEHLDDPLRALLRARELLRPAGLLALSTGDLGGFTARTLGRRWALLAPPGHLYYFSRRTLYAMLERAQLEPLSWQSDGVFLLNDPEGDAKRLPSWLVRWHHNRVVNAVLRRLRLGSIITVQARRH